MKDIKNKEIKDYIVAFFVMTIILITLNQINIRINQNKIIDKLIEIENKL